MSTVHPYKGYLNSVFHFYASGVEAINYNIYPANNEHDTPIKSGSFSLNIPHSIQLKKAGNYRIVFSDGTTSEIIVEDGYRYGGSEYKTSFIFDETPWCFVIMNDRTYFYNRETEDSYIETISPDCITLISKDYVILENTGQKERTIYSLNEQKPILNISNIVFYNEQVVVWTDISNEDNTKIIIYSLPERINLKAIPIDNYIINPETSAIIYQVNNVLHKQELSLPLKEEQTLRTYGQLVSLVAPYIAISIKKFYNSSNICIFDTRKNNLLSKITVRDAIASINSTTLIDINEHIASLENVDLPINGCEEATIRATYLSYQFYPTNWDVFYAIRKRIFERGIHCENNEFTYKVQSLNSNKEFVFDNPIKNVIIRKKTICFSNNKESLILGKNITTESSKNITTHIHNSDIVRVATGNISVLDDDEGWKPINITNFSFQYFDDFGIIKNEDNNSYIDLYGHTISGLPFVHDKPFKYLTINNQIILLNGKILPSLKSSISPSGKYCLIQEKDGMYMSESSNRKRILSDIFDTSSYNSVLLSEDGSQIMFRNEKQTVVLDLHTNTSDRYDNVSYIEDINGIRPLFSLRAGSLQPRLVNPVTGQIVPHKRMPAFQFISPNGILYADTEIDKYVETWNIITNEILSDSEITAYSKKFNYAINSDNEKDKLNKDNRRHFIEQNFTFFKQAWAERNFGKKSDAELVQSLLRLRYLEFSKFFMQKRGVAYIRNKSDNSVVAKIELGSPLRFLNYVSFSYDNRFVAIAGRYPNDSNLGGLFLVYDLVNGKEIIAKRNTWAVWMTSFTKQNQVAAYSSEPISYDSDLSDKVDTNVKSYPGFSFLTFSPNGEYAALSNQGYVSKYDRFGDERQEWGHMPSCEVFIVKSTQLDLILRKYSDLSKSGIDGMSDRDHSFKRTVSSVSFSNDNQRLMMVGNDGVVVIRNLHLECYAGE